MLQITDLTVEAAGKPVLNGVDLTLDEGSLHVLLGPNGSGKSSLLATIMGLPPFQVTGGDIRFDGQSILGLDICERAALGMGIAYQRPPSLDGVTVQSFAAALGAEDKLAAAAEALDLSSFLNRDINVGFSGGEVKRWEILKLILQDPRLLLFDEPESGVDLEHVIAVGRAIQQAVAAPDQAGRKCSALAITHTGLILNHVQADRGHIMKDGRIVHSGDAHEIFAHIQTEGYNMPAAVSPH